MFKEGKAWIIAVDMGYGHQRTAHPLASFAFGGKVINANNYEGIPAGDRDLWESTREIYESISKFKRIPLVGNFVFSVFDRFQRILSFYPKRDLSKPTFSLRRIFSFIKNGWGKDLVLRLAKNPLPLVSTFFTPAFMAEFFDYPGWIYCVICDADVSRAWVSLNPKNSKIKYCAPNSWVVNRLKLYGVKDENIFLTGYPLPTENIGTEKMEILIKDIRQRIVNLDPQKKHYQHYKPVIEKYLGVLPEKSDHRLTIFFSIGGAGAQKEIALKILQSLAEKIKKGAIKIILSVGIREELKDYFLKVIKKMGLADFMGSGIEILHSDKIGDYFSKFNSALRQTDILWTKPSELSFYTALGLPIIIAPTIGSQEEFNKKWLLRLGSGILQEDPAYTDQWLFDYLESGRFAEAAFQGFLEAEKMGTYNIQNLIFSK